MTQQLEKSEFARALESLPSGNERTFVPPQELDPSSEHAEEIARNAERYSSRPLETAREELLALAGFFEAALSRLPEEAKSNGEILKQLLTDRIVSSAPAESRGYMEQTLGEIFEHYNFVFEDILTLAHEVISEAELLGTPEGSKYIYYEHDNEIIGYIRPEAHTLLRRSRMLGLHPFSTLDELANLDIRCIGASVAAQIITLLGAYGVDKMKVADYGKVDVSNGPRLTDGMADVRNLGLPKVDLLLEGLYGRNPYGSYEGFNGMIVSGPTRIGEGDVDQMNVVDYVRGGDLIIEVIDSGKDKIELRLTLKDAGITTSILFPADIFNRPMSTIEQEGHEERKLFNQDISDEEWRARLEAMNQIEDPIQQQGANLAAILRMLDSDLSEQHAVSTLMILMGLQPFLAQDPGDTRANASLSTRLMLEMLRGNVVPGKKYTVGELEAQLVDQEKNREFVVGLLVSSLGG